MKPHVLYITYLGILEPIPKSQILPYLYGLSKEVNIHLLSFEKKNLFLNEKKELKRLRHKLEEKGISWHVLKYHKYPLVISSCFDIASGFVYALLLIFRYRLSILHARSDVPVSIGFLLKKIISLKLLYDRRGMMGEEHIEQSGWKKEGKLYRFSLWFEKKIFKTTDATVVLTNRMKHTLTESKLIKSNGFIETIPCCTNLDLFKPTSTVPLNNKFVFVYHGTLGTYNLLEEMLDFFIIALSYISEAHFLILTPNQNILLRTLEKYPQLKEKITSTYILHHELPFYLSQCRVGILFRKNSATAIAASPIKFSEYLACGLPVVSLASIGDVKELIETHQVGVALNRYSKEEYHQGIRHLLHLLKDEEGLKKRCRKSAETYFSVERGVKSYLEIYQKLILRDKGNEADGPFSTDLL